MKYAILLALLLAACSTSPVGSAPTTTLAAQSSTLSATPSLEGSGQVVFTQPSYSCATGGKVWHFTAYMKERAGSLKVQLVTARLDAAGTEKVIETLDLSMTTPDETTFSDGPIDISIFCADPYGVGTYKARIVSGDGSKTLAEGQFEITA